MNFQPQNQQYSQPGNIGLSKPNVKISNNIGGMKSVIAVVIVLQLAIFGILAYRFFVPKETLGDQIVKEVRKVAGVSQSLVPLDIVELDDTILEDLRNGNQIQEEVYKDAQSGDYVVIYEGRMIIYRRDGKTVVYDGLPPSQISQNSQVELLNKILERAKSQGLLEEGSEEVPQASVVEDTQTLIEQDPEFYARVQKGDIVTVFPKNKIIVLYNPNNDSIYKSGNVDTVITSFE